MTAVTEQLAWHVVHAQHNREGLAAAELARQGFRVFLPLFLKTRRHARRVTQVEAPLFPGYLFVAIDAARQRWRSINGTRGVLRLVTSHDAPSPVASRIVEDLLARRDGKGYIPMPVRTMPAPGSTVRVLQGSFSDALGLFEDVKGAERVAILMELLGRKVRVMLDHAWIEAAA